MSDDLARLPQEPSDWLTEPFQRFLRVEALGGAALLLSSVIALALSNSAWAGPFLAFWDIQVGLHFGNVELGRSLKHWINDGLMTLFFFVIALELKRELVLGELRDRRVAAFPIAAAVGGMAVPAALFLIVVAGGEGADGWGIVMSTDTAFVISCLAVLRSRIPYSLRLFLLALAIFDDIGAILVVALGYGGPLNWIAVGGVAFALAVIGGAARMGIRSTPVYFATGAVVWVLLDASGIHATLAGVLLGLMAPAKSWVSDERLHAIFDRVTAYPPGDHWSGNTSARRDLHRAGVAAREALSPIERLELALHPWVALAILPLFALANAGVPITFAGFDAVLTTAIFLAFVIGKPVGVVAFSLLAVKVGLARRPADLRWTVLASGSLLTGIGFTMALFIADLAFASVTLYAAKLGVLGASVVSAVLGFVALALTARPR